MSTANIRSIPVIRDVKIALMKFVDEGRGAVEIMTQEMLKAIDWVENDRPAYWDAQLKKAFDLVTSTRVALNACQTRKVAGRQPSCIEEKQAHDKAKRRLQFCSEQRELVKKWAVKIRHESDEFRGRLAGLSRAIDGDFTKAVATLESMARALESYAEMTAPQEESFAIMANAEDDTPSSAAVSEKPPAG